MAWGAMLKGFFMGQREPLLYSFQSAMPRLPVPSLEQTMQKYLESVKPILSEEELETSKVAWESFIKGEGKKFQKLLQLKSWVAGNYVSDWWEKYVYLRSRSPILINSNYYGLGYASHIPTKKQTARAARLVHNYMLFKKELESEKLKPTTIRGLVPICMRQYERLFSTTRIPGRDSDVLRHIDPSDSIHVAVLYKGTWWRLNAVSEEGVILPPHVLQDHLDFIVSNVGSVVPIPSETEANLPALTALNRTRWAEIREEHFGEGINKLSLEEIESSIFCVHLDERCPETWSSTGNLSLHGNGNTRWCDKSFNVVVYGNGEAAVHAEHSWADAPVIAHAWEWVLCKEHLTVVAGTAYDKSGHVCRPDDASLPDASTPASPALGTMDRAPSTGSKGSSAVTHRLPYKLDWMFDKAAQDAVQEAYLHATDMCKDLNLEVDCFSTGMGGYGKGFVKKQKCGPDAWIQLALQLAYYRDQGSLALTYEAAATRLFNEGRTETIRSVTNESKNAVLILNDPNASKEDKRKAIRAASDRHQSNSRDSSLGKGVDRHMFALYVCALGLGKEVNFLKDALSIPWKLSTSQIPQRQTDFKIEADVSLNSPSGGFGPVADDGYGVSYMMADDDHTYFHVSSKRSCKQTESRRFLNVLFQAFQDMREACTD
eukprot:CAMPEP_0184299254 /NCGR_PEP_ID=MMETSP1049-20130417/9893_1 /TAXON_ID=77928 /ORGANISM="Proteomonas sulcata, Strain CCMP704" /LENGTH=657 /DNA_ID=CAMNT_0026609627 /DNA_START=128 /DNA_END=2101 /DNA_ORIENTATION=+